jgi:hypothetical protein
MNSKINHDQGCNTCNSSYNRLITNCINCYFKNWTQVIKSRVCDCCKYPTKNLKFIVKMGIRGWYCSKCIKKTTKKAGV